MADSKNIWAATIPPTGGSVLCAPLGTTPPTNATTALDAAFVDLGWVTDDGVTNSIKRDTTKHYAWGGEVVKVTLDKYTETLKLSLYELSADVLTTVFGSANVVVDETAGHQTIAVEHSPLMMLRQVFVIDFIDGARTGRLLVREGQITEMGDMVLVHTKPTTVDITIDIYKTANDDPGVVVFYDNADVLAGS